MQQRLHFLQCIIVGIDTSKGSHRDSVVWIVGKIGNIIIYQNGPVQGGSTENGQIFKRKCVIEELSRPTTVPVPAVLESRYYW